MKRLILFFALLWSGFAYAGDRIISNPDSNGNITLKVNKAGTATTALTADGTNGRLLVPDGTAAIPGLSWLNSTTMGLFNSSGILGFATNGTNVGQVNTSGSWTLGPSAGGNINTHEGGFQLGFSGFNVGSNSTLSSSNLIPAHSFLRLFSATGTFNIIGISATYTLAAGQTLYLCNNSGQTATLVHNSLSDTATNRIVTRTAANVTLANDSCALLVYSNNSSSQGRWFSISP